MLVIIDKTLRSTCSNAVSDSTARSQSVTARTFAVRLRFLNRAISPIKYKCKYEYKY